MLVHHGIWFPWLNHHGNFNFFMEKAWRIQIPWNLQLRVVHILLLEELCARTLTSLTTDTLQREEWKLNIVSHLLWFVTCKKHIYAAWYVIITILYVYVHPPWPQLAIIYVCFCLMMFLLLCLYVLYTLAINELNWIEFGFPEWGEIGRMLHQSSTTTLSAQNYIFQILCLANTAHGSYNYDMLNNDSGWWSLFGVRMFTLTAFSDYVRHGLSHETDTVYDQFHTCTIGTDLDMRRTLYMTSSTRVQLGQI
jgi:hypothetical protein